MKHLIKAASVTVLAVCISVLAGCEWDSGSDSAMGSDVGVNVSGTYNLPGDGLVLSPNEGGVSTEDVVIGTGDGSKTDFYEVLPASQDLTIVPGSVSIQAQISENGDIEYFLDDSLGGLTSNGDSLVGLGGAGDVDYATGVLNVEFGTPPISNAQVVVTYSRYGPGADSTLPAIYRFTVTHVGGTIELVDSNGDVYTGTIIDPDPESTTTAPLAEEGDEDTEAEIADTLAKAYPFTVTGVSGGLNVEITGTINATITTYYTWEWTDLDGNYVELATLANFSMTASWVDDGGNTAAISASGPQDREIITVF